MPIRVLIVDDDSRFRDLARALLRSAGHIVVAEAGDGAEGLSAAERHRPDAALVDMQLPDTDGIALSRRLSAGWPELRIVLTSGDASPVNAAALAECGARAFVPKDELATFDLGAMLTASGGPPSSRRRRPRC